MPAACAIRTRGRLACPLVLRTPMGAGIRAPEHHSEATEAMFAHIPGVRVLVPSSPARAYGLLLAAIDDPDPVIFLEPTRLYRMNPQPLADDARRLPLDSCFTLREGGDLTLVSWGASVHETQQAAERLAQRGIEAEVIDVACLKPLDLDTLEASVRKTGRCVIVHEAPKSGGLGGEIAASLYERVLFDLRAPIQRVAAADIPPPLYRLEALYMPPWRTSWRPATPCSATPEPRGTTTKHFKLPDLGEACRKRKSSNGTSRPATACAPTSAWSRWKPPRRWWTSLRPTMGWWASCSAPRATSSTSANRWWASRARRRTPVPWWGAWRAAVAPGGPFLHRRRTVHPRTPGTARDPAVRQFARQQGVELAGLGSSGRMA